MPGSFAAPEDRAEETKLACLRVGSAYYALNILDVREIIRPVPLIEVPRLPTSVDGVITLRRAVVPVVDLRRRFGVKRQPEPRERIVICALKGRIIGLYVDEVSEVMSVACDEIQRAPYYMSNSESDFFPAVCRHRGRLIFLLDLQKILSSNEPVLSVPSPAVARLSQTPEE